MQTDLFIYLFIGAVCLFYLVVLISGRSGTVSDFYTLSNGITPLARGMASAADWLCAATFLGFFGLVATHPEQAHWVLIGWLLGLILLTRWIAPAVYSSGKACLTGWMSHYYQSSLLRYSFLMTLSVMSVVLLALQLKALGFIFSRHIQLSGYAGISIAWLLLAFYVVLSGMKAITRVQMLQYCIVLCGLMIPAIYMASEFDLTNRWMFLQGPTSDPVKLTNFVARDVHSGSALSTIEMSLMLMVLLAGTALLPHLLKRYQGVKTARDIHFSGIWMLLFVGVIYATMPWIAAKSEGRFYEVMNGPMNEGVSYNRMPGWFYAWEQTGNISWLDNNDDGRIQLQGANPLLSPGEGLSGDAIPDNFLPYTSRFVDEVNSVSPAKPTRVNELTIAEEAKLLVLPEMFQMNSWVISLLTVGISAALLSSASILLISGVNSIVLQSPIKQLSVRAQSHTTRWLALLLLISAAVIAFIFSGSLVAWLNGTIAVAAATMFPAVLLALLERKNPPLAVFAGMLGGLVMSVSYALAFEHGALLSVWPDGWPVYTPVAMAAVAMLFNFILVILVTWLSSLAAPQTRSTRTAALAE